MRQNHFRCNNKRAKRLFMSKLAHAHARTHTLLPLLLLSQPRSLSRALRIARATNHKKTWQIQRSVCTPPHVAHTCLAACCAGKGEGETSLLLLLLRQLIVGALRTTTTLPSFRCVGSLTANTRSRRVALSTRRALSLSVSLVLSRYANKSGKTFKTKRITKKQRRT